MQPRRWFGGTHDMKANSRDLQTLFNVGACGGFSDGQLLERFIARRDDESFEVLVRRHAPMVWGVCRRMLRRHHDAEDAFQATFLVLARKAGTVNHRETVAHWLYAVAYQTARKARAMSSRREGREKQMMEMAEPALATADLWTDLAPVLDEELSRLPDHYRAPIVLCDLEGKTRKEAARQLGWPEGTISSRLSRARSVLAKRLSRRGIVLTAGALSALLAENALAACPPASLLSSTARTAALIAAGEAVAAGTVSLKVAALTGGVLKSMLISKLKVVTVVLMAAGLLGTGLRASGPADRPQITETKVETTIRAPSSKPGDKPADPHRADPLAQEPTWRMIDQFIRSRVAENPAAAPLSDEAFLRRIYLDVQGRTATPAEIEQFKTDETERRAKLVEWLLREVGEPHRSGHRDALGSKVSWKESHLDLTDLHRRLDEHYRNWKIQYCSSCHVTQGTGHPNADTTVPEDKRNEIVRNVLVRQAVRDVDQLLKRLKEDLPDWQTELDALDEIEKAVRVMKEKVKQRKD